MGSSSSEDEDRSTTGAFPEGPPPAQTPVKEGGERTPPTGILDVMETQTVPTEESWRRWAYDFPPWKEIILT
jgi:hypothetical protein